MNATQLSATRHPRDDLHRFVNELNVRYNIGLSIPDPALSPSKRKEQGSASVRLYTRLEIHFYQGGVEALRSLTKIFDGEVKDYWSKWVKKPKGDHDTLPRTDSVPFAADHMERERLHSLFLQVLDRSQPTRSFGRTQSGPAAYSIEKSAHHHKRAADAEMAKTPTKRSRPVEQNARAALAKANDIFAPRPMMGEDRRRSTRTEASLNKSFQSLKYNTTMASSVNASKTSFPSVFSNEDLGLASTEDTMEASTQEQTRRPGTPSKELFNPTDKGVSYQPCGDYRVLSPRTVGAGIAKPKATQSSPTQKSESDYLGPTSSEMATVPLDLHAHVDARSKKAGQGQDRGLLDAELFQQTLTSPMHSIWPKIPTWLELAPYAVAWEVIRIAQCCTVDLNLVDLTYNSSWTKQTNLRSALWKHDAFRGHSFPALATDKAWEASLNPTTLIFDEHVIFSASLEFTDNKARPLRLTLQPPKIEQSHRLGRRFGSNRFVELLVPSPDDSNLPQYLKKDKSFFENLVQWLTRRPHAFCGRQWRPFYTKDGGAREPARDLSFGPPEKKVYQNRVYFFAERGLDLEELPLHSMLNWLLDFEQVENKRQPVLKLFQRIAIALSTTSPAVIFEPSQIRIRSRDLRSSKKRVMNDGVGRMSRAAARLVRDRLGLRTCPSAVQGRLGSAKGMWIIDIADKTDDVWIEIYPSQRKWKLDWATVDDYQRTLEVLKVASMPRSARLNLQFLPVIEDRAKNKDVMREAVSDLLRSSLQDHLNSQKEALHDPVQLRLWNQDNSYHKHDRAVHDNIPYQGGLPQEDEETINCMLDAGFEPKSTKFLAKLIYDAQRKKCETLKKKLNISVGRSANLLVVADFLGVLEENEIHVAFSTAFAADDEWNKTMVQGDVLVARSPAHFISDIQKVTAVFKPELADLTDVVVFSTKGDVPLADKLSGGDYDGDLAWVCWDDRLVGSFENAEVQEQPDLSRYIRKDKIQFEQLLKSHQGDPAEAISEMMEKSFAFNLTKSMLGSCTNYKESACYYRGSVSDDNARVLSTLLSKLVDQAKQGIEFTDEGFRLLKKDLAKDHGARQEYDRPAYKFDHWRPDKVPKNIIDYLKFSIAQPMIATVLKSLDTALNEDNPESYDQDLVAYCKRYEQMAQDPSELGTWIKGLSTYLKQEIGKVSATWDRLTLSYPEKVERTYELWQAIQPEKAPPLPEQPVTAFTAAIELLVLGGGLSHWELWKASVAFQKYKVKRFPWQMACRQLCFIKAQARCAMGPNVVMPEMYAVLRPDKKLVNLKAAREEGRSSHFVDQRDRGEDADEDDDDF